MSWRNIVEKAPQSDKKSLSQKKRNQTEGPDNHPDHDIAMLGSHHLVLFQSADLTLIRSKNTAPR